MRKLLLPAAAIAAGLTLAGPAAADTYCVHQGGATCAAGTTDEGANLQQALSDAAATPIADTVTLSAGTFTAPAGGFQALGGSALQIVGAGPATILDGATSPIIYTSIHDLAAVAVDAAGTVGAVGVKATGGGTLSHLLVTGSASSNEGIRATGDVHVTDSVITVPNAVGVTALAAQGSAPTVQDSTITAQTAVWASGTGSTTPVRVHRVTTFGGGVDLLATGATLAVDNSVLRHSSSGGYALSAECSGGGAHIVADHVTAIADALGGGAAIGSSCATAGATSSVGVANSTLREFPQLTWRVGTGGGTADILLSYSDGLPGTINDSGPGMLFFGIGMLASADPGFVSTTDAHLALGSPLINAGDPLPSPFAFDHDGLLRVADGRQDIGAYESLPAVATGGAGSASGGGTFAPAPETAPSGDGDVPPTGAMAAPSPTPAVPAPAVPRTTLRAALRHAISTGGRGVHTFRWPKVGRVSFQWRAHGHVVARGTKTTKATGATRVRVRPTRAQPRLARHTTVRVRATFIPAPGGRPVTVVARLKRP
jgi:hypothetical protein